MRSMLFSLLIAFSLLSQPSFLSAQTQAKAEGKDVFVILDTSGSMNEQGKFLHIKQYLEKDVIGSLLETGDFFGLILFGNTAKESFSQRVTNDQDKTSILTKIRALKADDDFTDIGTAMEKLYEMLSKRNSTSKQTILFITDGKHTPPRTSPYYGKDLALDARFKDIGQKISKAGWFLYVVGIGNETDAKKIADSVENSVVRTTDSKLSKVDIQEYFAKTDTARKELEAKTAAEKAAKEAAEKASREAEERKQAGIFGVLFGGLAGSFGISLPVITAIAAGLLLVLFLFLVFLLYRAFRPVRLSISDNVMGKAETLERSLRPWSWILFNSLQDVLPSIGDENRPVFRLERGFLGLRIRIEDEEAVAEGSPYKKKGVHPLKKTIIELANGNRIRIAVKK